MLSATLAFLAAIFAEAGSQLLEPPLERAHPLQQLGQPGFGDHDPPRLRHRPGRSAEHSGPGLDAARNPGLGAGDHAVTERDMVGDADLAGEYHAAPQAR